MANILQGSVLLLVVLFTLGISAETPSFQITEVTGATIVAKSNNSTLYNIQLQSDPYGASQPIRLLDLHGDSYYQMGYDYGVLVGKASVNDFNSLLDSVLNDTMAQLILERFLQWQWDAYLSKQVPDQFMQEIQGITDAGTHQRLPKLGAYVTYGVVLANFPGEFGSNLLWLLVSEWDSRSEAGKFADIGFSAELVAKANALRGIELFHTLEQTLDKMDAMHCSMFGVWGNRTQNGELFTMRNLDWFANTGVSTNKLITVYHPPTGNSYLTIGFAGLIGALTGMNSQGLTVHEATNDSRNETFLGFPWTLRLRQLMQQCSNLAQAKSFWEGTSNTLGLNHGVGSAKDKQFLALETMADYTAYFYADDPREAALTAKQPNGQELRLGFPLPDALWRTNHGFDPAIVQAEVDPPTDYSDNSEERYLLIHDSFVWYAEAVGAGSIGVLQAINVTSIVGAKGQPDFHSCANSQDGSNIISVTYRPGTLEMWVSFEVGGVNTNLPRLPACCGTYAHMSMANWLKN